MALNLLNDVFLLHLALEAAQRIFEEFSLLKSDFRQTELHPQTRPVGPDSYCNILQASQGGIAAGPIVRSRLQLVPAKAIGALQGPG